MKRSHKRMKGGFLDNIGSTLSSWSTSLSNSAKNAWDKTKSVTSDAYNSTVGTSQTPSSDSLQTTTNSSISYNPSTNMSNNNISGGKRKSKKNKRGGFSANSSLNNLASRSASFSGSTAKPHTYVGGKKSKRHHHKKHKHTKTCRHNKPHKH